jgi:hypothetical protein
MDQAGKLSTLLSPSSGSKQARDANPHISTDFNETPELDSASDFNSDITKDDSSLTESRTRYSADEAPLRFSAAQCSSTKRIFDSSGLPNV